MNVIMIFLVRLWLYIHRENVWKLYKWNWLWKYRTKYWSKHRQITNPIPKITINTIHYTIITIITNMVLHRLLPLKRIEDDYSDINVFCLKFLEMWKSLIQFHVYFSGLHNYAKDVMLFMAVLLAIGISWFACLHHRYSQTQVKKMMKDLEALQKAEDALKKLSNEWVQN